MIRKPTRRVSLKKSDAVIQNPYIGFTSFHKILFCFSRSTQMSFLPLYAASFCSL